jgi:mannose-6-phosphate isomerase-like protein (cupin superfamily)
MVAPPGISHFFRNPGPGRERNLNLHAPGERFLALARARASGEAVDGSEFDLFAPEPGGEGVISGPGEGERLQSEHGQWLIKAVLPQLSVIEQELSPGAADRGPHCHERHVEAFYVLAGSVEFSIGAKNVHAREGTSVVIPPGVRHALKNSGSETARLLNVHAPESGYVEYLRAHARGDEVDPAHHDVHNVD